MLFLLHRPEELMPIRIIGGSDSGLQVLENMSLIPILYCQLPNMYDIDAVALRMRMSTNSQSPIDPWNSVKRQSAEERIPLC